MSTLLNGTHSQTLSYQVIKDEVGGAYILYGGEKNCDVGFGGGTEKRRRLGMPRRS
jgi:hypothetical protein